MRIYTGGDTKKLLAFTKRLKKLMEAYNAEFLIDRDSEDGEPTGIEIVMCYSQGATKYASLVLVDPIGFSYEDMPQILTKVQEKTK